LRRQLAVTPGDVATRFNLASALVRQGRTAEALPVAREHAGHPRLARLAGWLLQEAGEQAEAIGAYQAALAVVADDWEAWNNLGNCLVAADRRAEAITAFENAINRSPQGAGTPEIFVNLLQVLTVTEDRDSRLKTAEEARRRFPGHPDVELELGLAQVATGDTDAAEATLRRLADTETSFGAARLELGLLYETTNRLDDLDALVAEAEQLGESPELAFLKAWSLRRRNRFEEADALAGRIPETINPIRTAQLRAEIADRLGRHDEAFALFTRMNEAAAAAFPPLAGPTFRETVEVETATMAAALAPVPATDGDPVDPVFIVGSPRSGTTLLDTLLNGMPELQVFEERPMLSQLESEFPDLATTGDARRVVQARARYHALAESLEGAAEGRRIVDKMPLHITHMPVIHRLFPQADVVLVERHPCDAVLSCFMANFSLNHAMRSYGDIEEAARTYDAIFANWSKARLLLPLRVHEVRYERMIADLEGEMRPLLGFLGLSWRDEVLDNQGNAAKRGQVRTASYSQIGQPLYTRAIGRWQAYAAHLEPVMPILMPWIERLGYPA
jgi:tetratricopeptide (TPR) repeat protein